MNSEAAAHTFICRRPLDKVSGLATLKETTMTTPIALITGGSRGIGKSTALHVAATGSDVILTYLGHAEAAQQVVREIEQQGRRAVALQLDVAESQQFGAFAAQVKQTLNEVWQRPSFDHLVNNAGTGLHASFAETTEAEFDNMVNVHLKSAFFLTQKLLPLIADGGRIVNISSGLARFTLDGSSAYAIAKGGVEVLTRYLAKELAPRGITANAVAPGAIATDFRGGAVRDKPQINAAVAKMIALGRVGLPDDIGAVIANLLRADNGWITGQCIEASGGQLL